MQKKKEKRRGHLEVSARFVRLVNILLKIFEGKYEGIPIALISQFKNLPSAMKQYKQD
jgi:hypothetical protein